MAIKLHSVAGWDLRETARDLELRYKSDIRAHYLREACKIKGIPERRKFLTDRGFDVVGYIGIGRHTR